jgi:hypothetical protein
VSAFGFVFIAIGILAMWASFKRVSVLDVLKTFVSQKPSTPIKQGGTAISAVKA